tara:strand:- start:1751 stop:2260 length:510 start_codon:yes stop_codon:yes gene_type:complete
MPQNMPRNQYFDQLVTPFSYWHRSQHNGIAYSDLDMVSICPACAAPLLLADHIYNKDNKFRSKSEWLYRPYKIIAKCLKIPFFTIWYSVDENTENREITEFHVRNNLSEPRILRLEPDWMLQYLEYKVLQHAPQCPSKKYLLQRVTEANEHNNNFLRQYDYVKILLNRS